MKKINLINVVLIVVLHFAARTIYAQSPVPIVERVVIVNGGKFEFSPPFADYVDVTMYETNSKTIVSRDTIFAQSAQDLFVDEAANSIFVAAGDSLIRYSLDPFVRVASVAFGSASPIKMAVHNNHLLVGNWYGSTTNNFRIFDKLTLAFIDSIPEVMLGAKDMVVVGDTAYIQQNFSSSSFTDSAGYFSIVDLTNLTHVRDQALDNNEGDLGRLHHNGSIIYGVNSETNTITSYNVSTSISSTVPVGTDVQVGFYGPQSLLWNDTLYFKSAAGLAAYNINSWVLIDSALIDTMVTAFDLDTINLQFYLTQTDFASYTRGGIFDFQGNFLDSLPVGFSPELVSVIHEFNTGIAENTLPSAFQLYPNPAQEVFTIAPFHPGSYDLQLFNQLGQLCLSRSQLKGETSIELGAHPAGTYVVRLIHKEEVETSLLIVQ
jgi:hypothetical protein